MGWAPWGGGEAPTCRQRLPSLRAGASLPRVLVPEADVSLPQVAGVRRLRGCAQPPNLWLQGLGSLPHRGRLLPRLLQRQGTPLPGAEAQDGLTGPGSPGTPPAGSTQNAAQEALKPLEGQAGAAWLPEPSLALVQ